MTFTQTEEQVKIQKRFSSVTGVLDQAILYLGESNGSCQGSGYVVSGYFRGVLEELDADLGERFRSYEREINGILAETRKVATSYIYGPPPLTPTNSHIINVNLEVISYCNFYLAVLRLLIQLGVDLPTSDAVSIMDDMYNRAVDGQKSAIAIQNTLNQYGLELTNLSRKMTDIVDRLADTVGGVGSDVKEQRHHLNHLDISIQQYEQQLAEEEGNSQISSTKVVTTAVLLRGVVRRIIRGVAFIRNVRETSEEIRRLRDRLAGLHSERARVYALIAEKEEAVASAESYDEHISIQLKRTRQAVQYMGNMANSWGSQAFAIGQIRQITVNENASSVILLLALMEAQTSIEFVLAEAQRIHQEMLNVPFYEEPVLTLPEVYLMGKSSAFSTEWQYPNSEIEVIKRSLLEKYGKGERSAE